MNVRPMLLVSTLALAAAGCTTGGSFDPLAAQEGRIDYRRTTQFDGSVLTVDMSSDDRTLKLNTVRDAIATEEFRPPIPNQSGRSWVLRNTAHDSTSLVYAVVSWDNEDPTDYLAAGWWVHVPLEDPDPRSIERAIFIDGPEIEPTVKPPDMPASGRAHYAGGAGGLFEYEFGSDWGDLASEYALGEFTATMTITADFDKGTIAGCLGCVGDIEAGRRHLASVYEDILEVDLPDIPAPARDYEFHFAPVAYRRNGTFEGASATVAHPERTPETLDGFWGGAFSSVDGADGNPRLVSGFTDAWFTEPDGSAGYLLGIFNALSAATPQGE